MLDFAPPEKFIARIRELGSCDDKGDPHLRPAWFELLATAALEPETQLALCSCSTKGSSHLALQRQKDSSLVSGLANFYTPIFGLIGEQEVELDCVVELARGLLRGRSGVSEIRLAPMDPLSCGWECLRSAFHAAGWLVSDYYLLNCIEI